MNGAAMSHTPIAALTQLAGFVPSVGRERRVAARIRMTMPTIRSFQYASWDTVTVKAAMISQMPSRRLIALAVRICPPARALGMVSARAIMHLRLSCRTAWVRCNLYATSFGGGLQRSEEHTSELQSRENLVCR